MKNRYEVPKKNMDEGMKKNNAPKKGVAKGGYTITKYNKSMGGLKEV